MNAFDTSYFENASRGEKRKAVDELCKRHADLKDLNQRTSGSGMLTYIEGNALIDNMNEVFGSTGWNTRIVSLEGTLLEPRKWEYMCTIEVTVSEFNSVRQDVGFGAGDREKASKEAVTDAIKRACRQYGNYFGNSLYDKGHLAELEIERKQKKQK